MQRRIKQTNGYRATSHCFKDTFEVFLLIWKNLSQCFPTSFCIFRQDHFTHCFDLFAFEEHVFCTAKADTYCTEVTCNFRIMRSVRIGTYLQTSIFISQCHQFGKVAGKLCSFRFYLTIIYYTCTSVQRDIVTFFQQHHQSLPYGFYNQYSMHLHPIRSIYPYHEPQQPREKSYLHEP